MQRKVSGQYQPFALFLYDGDGNRVQQHVYMSNFPGIESTTYAGAHLEVQQLSYPDLEIPEPPPAYTWYYYAGSQRVALRTGSDDPTWLLTDHLGSTSMTVDANGDRQSETRYKPWGETRYTWGTTPTSILFTGQRLDDTGLYFYNARYYDPAVGRFTQADSIVPEPGNPQSLNRFSYVLNNPLKYTDPLGHCVGDPTMGDDELCWAEYDKAIGILGQSFDFLRFWAIEGLKDLNKWLDADFIFQGPWDSPSLRLAIKGLNMVETAIGDINRMRELMGARVGRPYAIRICPLCDPSDKNHDTEPELYRITLNDTGFSLIHFIHEVGHQIDYGLARANNLPTRLWSEVGLVGIGWDRDSSGKLIYDVNSNQAAYSTASPAEDFADTFFTWVVGNNNLIARGYNLTDQRRAALITQLR